MDEIPGRGSIIPKWANDKAGQVIAMFSRGDNAYIDRALLHGAFAAALVQERERCAKAADHFTSARNVRRARELTTHEVYEIKIIARLIAAAIRKGPIR